MGVVFELTTRKNRLNWKLSSSKIYSYDKFYYTHYEEFCGRSHLCLQLTWALELHRTLRIESVCKINQTQSVKQDFNQPTVSHVLLTSARLSPGSSLQCAGTLLGMLLLPERLQLVRVSLLLLCRASMTSAYQSLWCLWGKENSNTETPADSNKSSKNFLQTNLVSEHKGDYFQHMHTPLLLTLGRGQKLDKIIKTTNVKSPQQPIVDAGIVIYFL